METILKRIGNDITIVWNIFNKDGSEFFLEDKKIGLFLSNPRGRREIKNFTVSGNVITWVFAASEQIALGNYTLTVSIDNGKAGNAVLDKRDFLRLLPKNFMEKEKNPEGILEGDTISFGSELNVFQIMPVIPTSDDAGNIYANGKLITDVIPKAIEKITQKETEVSEAERLRSEAETQRQEAEEKRKIETSEAINRISTVTNKAEELVVTIDDKIAKKQEKTDESLKTNDKTVVGAINEVYKVAQQGGSGGTSDAVLYIPQELSEEQKTQARNNINAQSKNDETLETDDKTVVGAINELNENKAENNDVPTKLSQLENDAEFIKNTASNLVNYYLKSDTYTKSEVNALIAKIIQFTIKKVSVLPVTGEDNIIYLVPSNNGDENNIYDEYLWLDSKWESIGNTKINLSDYYTIEQTNEKFVEKIAGKSLSTNDYTNSDKEKVANAQPKEEGKGLSTNDYTTVEKQKLASALLHTEQELTDAQQEQARDNISAAPIVTIIAGGEGSITKEIKPNVYYMFGEVTGLTLTLAQGKQYVLNEYMFEFVSGSTPTVLNEISGIEWLGDKIQSNRKYQASISNGIGILIGRNIS